MRVIQELGISDGRVERKIQICVGDLVDVPAGFETDILGVSAFNGDYTETSSSLIGALGHKGIHVGMLKRNQPVSLTGGNSWISQSLSNAPLGIPYQRIACTETPYGSAPRQAVGYFLTGLAGFLIRNPELKSVSVPVLGAGDQGDSKEGAFKNLIKEVAICLRGGLQLILFRVVVRPSDEHYVARWLEELRAEDAGIADAYDRTPKFDAFLSYSRRDTPMVSQFYGCLQKHQLRVFMDQTSLEPGDVWPEKLDVAIARSRLFVAFVSSSFNSSIYCKQETDHAERLHGSGAPSLFPIRIEKVEPVPPLAKRHAATLGEKTGLLSPAASVDTLCVKIRQRVSAIER